MDFETQEENDWIRFGTEKIPNDVQIEIMFSDGTILDYDDENWPFLEVTHWRFKINK